MSLRKPQSSSGSWAARGKLVLFLVLTVLAAGGYWIWRSRSPEPTLNVGSTSGQPMAPTDSVPPYFESAKAAQPLPLTLTPETFAVPVVRHAYRVARDIPAVVAQQPCYCHCDKSGHRSLLDCYASDHGAG